MFPLPRVWAPYTRAEGGEARRAARGIGLCEPLQWSSEFINKYLFSICHLPGTENARTNMIQFLPGSQTVMTAVIGSEGTQKEMA